MEFIMENKELLIALAVLLGIGIYLICVVVREPKKIKEWLIWACAQAEEKLGSGTGKLKLREVYSMFIKEFPVFSKLISFEKFQEWTEDALATLKDWIEKNPNLAARTQGPDNK